MSKEGLPIGLQLIGKHHQEEVLYQLGTALELEMKKTNRLSPAFPLLHTEYDSFPSFRAPSNAMY